MHAFFNLRMLKPKCACLVIRDGTRYVIFGMCLHILKRKRSAANHQHDHEGLDNIIWGFGRCFRSSFRTIFCVLESLEMPWERSWRFWRLSGGCFRFEV